MSDPKAPDFEPPLSNVVRVIKSVLPDNMSLSKDAKAAFVRATGIFIFYLTHCANDFSKDNKRRTIQTVDVLNALKELGFEDFEGPMEEFLDAYRKQEREKKKPPLKPKDGTEIGTSGIGGDETNNGNGDDEEEDGDDEGAAMDGADDEMEQEQEQENANDVTNDHYEDEV